MGHPRRCSCCSGSLLATSLFVTIGVVGRGPDNLKFDPARPFSSSLKMNFIVMPFLDSLDFIHPFLLASNNVRKRIKFTKRCALWTWKKTRKEKNKKEE